MRINGQMCCRGGKTTQTGAERKGKLDEIVEKQKQRERELEEKERL